SALRKGSGEGSRFLPLPPRGRGQGRVLDSFPSRHAEGVRGGLLRLLLLPASHATTRASVKGRRVEDVEEVAPSSILPRKAGEEETVCPTETMYDMDSSTR